MKNIWIGSLLAVVALVSAALVGPAAVAAPAALDAPASTDSLARAVRLNPPAPPAAPAPGVSSVLSDMLDGVNAERSARGLAPMRFDDRLVLAAQRHSDDQARRGQMSHTGSDGSTVGTRVDRAGYDWRSVGENVAAGQPDVAAVMAAWMASAGHRRNILSTNTDIGVGVAFGQDGRPYWTQVFATPG
jgi:uncharacterized protein YkwD